MMWKPIFEPFGLRSLLKNWIENNKFEGLAEVFITILDLSDAYGGVEVAAVVIIDRFTGIIIDVVYEIGAAKKVPAPIRYRKYLNPRFKQILIHNHPSGTLKFSKKDLRLMFYRFNKSVSNLGLFRMGIDDEWILVVFNRDTGVLEYINRENF